MAGAKLVLPAQYLDGASIYELMRDEKVTFSQGVPTVWQMLFEFLDGHAEIDPRELALKRVSVGGSALSRAMLERLEGQFGVEVIQGWGMTETSPVGVINRPLPRHAGLTKEERTTIKLKQGRGVWGVELKIVDDEGRRLPWDGKAFGNLRVRGHWIASGYYRLDDEPMDDEGFFPTGDVATIDPDGYVQLVDRVKDVIKSGGEWISSIDVENTVMGCDGVLQAAIIGVPHPKWQERPLLIVVRSPGSALDRAAVLEFLGPRLAKWWRPDDVVFTDALPLTATGKILKSRLREIYRDHPLPGPA